MKKKIFGFPSFFRLFSLAGLLVFALSGCFAKKPETWNSYYYGYQEVDGKFTYTDSEDNDSQYVAPRHKDFTNHSLDDYHPEDSMMDARAMMRRMQSMQNFR